MASPPDKELELMRPSLLATQVNYDNQLADTPGVFTALRPQAQDTGSAGTAPSRDWLLGLSRALQTTLDVKTLIELFARQAGLLVPHDGIEFTGPDAAVQVTTGSLGEHRCSYDVVLQEQQLGQIVFTRSHPFESGEMPLLEVALANLVHPLRNALLYREALEAAARDALTGLSNRASFDAILEREVELSRRHGYPFSVAMLDVDRFKRLNDTHGHLAGDRALVAVAQCVKAQVRDSDMVFRYGGEEFCVLLSNTRIDGALILGERIRAAIEQTVVEVEGERVPISMSIGVAALRAGMDAVDLVARADAALYEAKQSGRNRVAGA